VVQLQIIQGNLAANKDRYSLAVATWLDSISNRELERCLENTVYYTVYDIFSTVSGSGGGVKVIQNF
jgi:hypothetical protein